MVGSASFILDSVAQRHDQGKAVLCEGGSTLARSLKYRYEECAGSTISNQRNCVNKLHLGEKVHAASPQHLLIPSAPRDHHSVLECCSRLPAQPTILSENQLALRAMLSVRTLMICSKLESQKGTTAEDGQHSMMSNKVSCFLSPVAIH